MKTIPLLCLFSISSLTFATSPIGPTDLLNPAAWKDHGEWSEAATVEGSATEKKWESLVEGEGIFYNGALGKTTNVVSEEAYGDVEVFVEFMIPKSSNSGIYFMNRYEVQILDSFGKADGDLKNDDCAGIYERWDDSKEKKEEKGYEGTAPSSNASTAPGTWQTFRILFRAPRFDAEGKKTENARFVRVEHNGTVVHENVEVTGPTRGGAGGDEVATAPFKVQGDHGPVAFRQFLVTPRNWE